MGIILLSTVAKILPDEERELLKKTEFGAFEICLPDCMEVGEQRNWHPKRAGLGSQTHCVRKAEERNAQSLECSSRTSNDRMQLLLQFGEDGSPLDWVIRDLKGPVRVPRVVKAQLR